MKIVKCLWCEWDMEQYNQEVYCCNECERSGNE
jgi:hypothetical protein